MAEPSGNVIDAGHHYRRYGCKNAGCMHEWELRLPPHGWHELESKEAEKGGAAGPVFLLMPCPQCQGANHEALEVSP